MLTVEQLAHRARKLIYRQVVRREGSELELMTIGTAVVTVVREAGQPRDVTEVNRYVRANPFYHAPSLAEPINIVRLDLQRRRMAGEILAAGANTLVVKNCVARFASVERKVLFTEAFDECVQAWIDEAALHGIKAEHVGRPKNFYWDDAASDHGSMMGTVRIVDTDQLLVVTATNRDGRHHVAQVRGLKVRDYSEAQCFTPIAA